MLRLKFNLMLLLAFAAAKLSAATYYVSPTGSDSNPGSKSQPFLTVQKAANTVAAGDVVSIAAGLYAQNVTVSASGNSGSPITFTGPGTVQSFNVTGSYITLTNLSLGSSNGTSPMIELAGNHACVTSCRLNGYLAVNTGVQINGTSAVVTNLDVTGLAQGGVAVNINACTNALVVGCKFHDMDNLDAIFFIWGVSNTVRGNLVTNVMNSGYSTLGIHNDFVQTFAWGAGAVATNIVIEGNTVINDSLQCFMLNSANTGIAQQPGMGGWTIRNNVFANCPQSGFVYLPFVSIYNNVFYSWGTANAFAFDVDAGGSAWGNGSNCVVYNNVFLYGDPSGNVQSTWGWFALGAVFSAPANFVADYNYAAGANYSSKSLNELHAVTGVNPLFVGEAGLNFHLSTNSPLIGAGTNLSALFTSDKDGNLRPTIGKWDIGPYAYGSSGNTNPIITASLSSLDFGLVLTNTSANLNIVVANVGGGTLTGSASVSAPFSIVSGGTYSLGANSNQAVTVQFRPTAAGTTNGTIAFTSNGGNINVNVTGLAFVLQSSLSLDLSAGTIVTPFTVTNVSSPPTVSNYVSQASTTGLSNSGEAVYGFSITDAGNYALSAQVNAPSTSANSFYINIDGQPTDPTMIWDIPVTGGFTNLLVSWRGSGTDTNNQFVPKVFSLSAGVHQLIVRGREGGTQLANIRLISYIIPPAPQNLRVMSQ